MAELYLSRSMDCSILSNVAPFNLAVSSNYHNAWLPFVSFPGAGAPLATQIASGIGINNSVSLKRIRAWCNFGDGLVPNEVGQNLGFLICHGQGNPANGNTFYFRPSALNEWVEFDTPVPISRASEIIAPLSGLYIQPNTGYIPMDPRNIADVFNGSIIFIRVDVCVYVGGL